MARPRNNDPEAVKRDILRVSKEVFAESGLSGARVDEIARRTKTSKRMIYYYFGDKTGLYQAVLEEAYREVRAGELALKLESMPPKEALAALVRFTFDHHAANPDFIRLVMIENIHHGEYLQKSESLKGQNEIAIRNLETIYLKGVEEDVFKSGLSPVELHWHISALSFFNVSNRYTFGMVFGDNLFAKEGQEKLRQQAVDTILGYVSK